MVRVGPDAHETAHEYDGYGALVAVTYPAGQRFTLDYDRLGRLLALYGADGRIASFVYDAQHNVIQETGARGVLGIDTSTWLAAEEAWDERILDAVGEADAAFLAQLDLKTAEARMHWTRRLPPLDEELGAWLAFLHAWKSDPDPVTFLRRICRDPC